MNKYATLLSPTNYGGLNLKNRIIFAPTTLGLNHKKYYDFLSKIILGGASMIIIGDIPITRFAYAPSIYSKRNYNFFAKIIKLAHENNCKVCAQLEQTDTKMSKIGPLMPKLMSKKLNEKEKQDLMNKATSDYISNIPNKKVYEILSHYQKTAILVKQLGFDMIQIHGDRMCGSFSSSIFNKRNDEFGGDIKNRALFAKLAITNIKEAVKDMPIDFKLVVRLENPHYGNAGVTINELKEFVPILVDAGVNSFHVTLANHSKLDDAIPPFNHPYFSHEGCFLKMCDEVRKYCNVSICGVGNLVHPDFIEHELDKGRIDVVAMSRQLICDPNYINKLLNNKEKEIRYCIHCNKGCLGGIMKHKGVSCILNK